MADKEESLKLGKESEYCETLQLDSVLEENRAVNVGQICYTKELSYSSGEMGVTKQNIFTWKGTSLIGSNGAFVFDRLGKIYGISAGYVEDMQSSNEDKSLEIILQQG